MYVGSCGDTKEDCCQTSPSCSPLPQQEDLPRALPSAKTVHLWTDTTQGNEQGENDHTTALLNSKLGLDEKKRRRRPPRCWLYASKMAATISGCSTADERKTIELAKRRDYCCVDEGMIDKTSRQGPWNKVPNNNSSSSYGARRRRCTVDSGNWRRETVLKWLYFQASLSKGRLNNAARWLISFRVRW
jgi:hypothetical protein